LRQEISAPTPPNVADPLEVLAGIIRDRKRGSKLAEDGIDPNDTTHAINLVEDIDFGGLSLQEFAEKDWNKTTQGRPVTATRAPSGNDCMLYQYYLSSHKC